MNAFKHVLILLSATSALAQSTMNVKIEANATLRFEFPELPQTLAKQTARLTARLPANYSPKGKFPLFVFINGGDGGPGDSLPIDRGVVGSNNFICVNLPIFKRVYDKERGRLISVDDLNTLSRAYHVMLQKLLDAVSNITPERSALGGFSNGAHAIALLVAGQDDFILQRFQAFYFVEGGAPLAVNTLGRRSLRGYRFLLMRGDYLERQPVPGWDHLFRAVEFFARDNQLDFTSIVMRDTEHAFPRRYQALLGLWVRGEKLPDPLP
jgi:hypothetical protein